jgi:hypothetical protein
MLPLQLGPAMGITPLGDDELYADMALSQATRADLADRSPLWFYVLRELGDRAKSAGLGPIGGRIVAETLVRLLPADPLWYLRVWPARQPTLEGR